MESVRALQVLETKIYGPQIKLQVTPLKVTSLHDRGSTNTAIHIKV